jgi:conjugative transfer signal peptidase TraF
MFEAMIGLALGAIALLAAPALLAPAPRLVWNATASAPIGLYALSHHDPHQGDLVLAQPPIAIAALAAARGYLPLHVPLVKRIAAGPGDWVCTRGDAVLVGRHIIALRVAYDPKGRALPYWEGCGVLRPGELFLLMPQAPHSFDSRYFGPVSTASVIGVLRPLWTR